MPKSQRLHVPGRLSVAALLPLLVAGCATGGAQDPFSASPRPGENVVLTVENASVQDLRIYVVLGETSIPLGRVGSLTTERFSLDRWTTSSYESMRFEASTRAGGGDSWTSPKIVVSGGTRLHMIIRNHLALSTVFIEAP